MAYRMTLPIGSLLDSGVREYRIVEVLGQGGFGITYKATGKVKIGNIEMAVPFAIKEHFVRQFNERRGTTVTVPNSSNATEVNESIEAFLSEARRLNRLSLEHPGIVKVNENFRANGTAYYVMEYFDGESLRCHVQRHAGGRLPESEAVTLIRQLGESVQYLHDHCLTHLDIKPDNVLLRGDGRPVLIDFGLSKHYDKKGRATSTLKVLGTAEGYSPIEQYAGITTFSPKADVYALAATLLFLLSGKDPANAIDISPASIRGALDTDIGRPVVDAILSAMRKLPEERTASVSAFLGMLAGERNGAESKKKEEADTSQTELIRSRSRGEGISSLGNWHPSHTASLRKLAVGGAAVVLLALSFLGLYIVFGGGGNDGNLPDAESDIVLNDKAEDSDSDVESFTVSGVSFNMVRVEGGTFRMGSDDADAESDEKPVHQVTLSSYSIGETEVTQELWEVVMGSNPSEFKGAKRPVESVSRDDCQAFIGKLNQATGKKFRLPTEAEWEYAARGGRQSRGFKYAGSNTLGDVAWYDDNSGDETHPVKTKQANELGLYDMSGNVWEWCQDWYGNYSGSAQTNPTGASSGSRRVRRGGGWYYNAGYCRSSNRGNITPSFRNYYLGLRLAL